ncbi:putative acid phosphatase 5 [Orussus abietinus]|uniref:putative acid phosphatase 5 n=1 Tax=Orussus abietinus TaxID=222816 RepID=UPI000626E9F2|nr:putative acid phosphatase 5 [Orussus abietinus]
MTSSKALLISTCRSRNKQSWLFILSVLIICIYKVHADVELGETPNRDVIQVHVLFRHGDRTPLLPLFGKQGGELEDNSGILTKKGMLQLFARGLWIRQHYGHLLRSTYKPSEISIVSTSVDRTIMSVQCLLASLYYPNPLDAFVPGLIWRPVPVHTNLGKLEKATKSIPLEYLTHPQHYLKQSAQALLHPELAKQIAYGEFTGPLLNEILYKLKSANQGSAKSVHLYSAHDITVSNVLNTLGINETFTEVNFAGTLIIELRKVVVNGKERQEVKVKFLNDPNGVIPSVLEMPGCKQPCSLLNLEKFLRKVIKEDPIQPPESILKL